jgi:hypothetical protein
MTDGQLTELELTKLENFALKHTGLQQAIRENLAARTQYIQQITAAHPGYTFSEQTGQLQQLAAASSPAQTPEEPSAPAPRIVRKGSPH